MTLEQSAYLAGIIGVIMDVVNLVYFSVQFLTYRLNQSIEFAHASVAAASL